VPENLANALAAGKCLRHVVPQASNVTTVRRAPDTHRDRP
jgi:hypothetical protein